MQEIITKFLNSSELPLVVEPVDAKMDFPAMLKLLDRENAFFKKQLLKYGGLLLRNFPVHDADDFASVIENLKVGKAIDYIGGDSPRIKLKRGIYTSTEAPSSVKIPLHNELSFVKNYPKYIFFYCDTPPVNKGETILGDCRKIYRALKEDVKERFQQKGLKYVSCYHKGDPLVNMVKSHKKWTDVFETEDKKEVERKCQENEFFFKWHPKEWLEISQVRPAVLAHPETKELVWFNQAHLYDFNPKLLGWWKYLAAELFYNRKYTKLHEVFFADGEKIPRDDLYHILDVLDQNTVAFPWQKGDVLVLDNVLTMHGRATFTGKRRILAAMT